MFSLEVVKKRTQRGIWLVSNLEILHREWSLETQRVSRFRYNRFYCRDGFAPIHLNVIDFNLIIKPKGERDVTHESSVYTDHRYHNLSGLYVIKIGGSFKMTHRDSISMSSRPLCTFRKFTW